MDLVESPDAATLISSSRDLRAVDDVHALPYEIILKSGVIGLLFAGLLLIKLLFYAVRASSASELNILILMTPWVAYLGDGITAATHLMAAPLPWLGLGMALSRIARMGPRVGARP